MSKCLVLCPLHHLFEDVEMVERLSAFVFIPAAADLDRVKINA